MVAGGHTWLAEAVCGCWGACMVAAGVCVVARGVCMVAGGACVVKGGVCMTKGGMHGKGGRAWDTTRYDQ